MKNRVSRQTVDLSAYPDLVVIYLGMRVNSLRGLWTIIKFGPRINQAVEAKPDGLLLHEPITYSLFPLHAGMRQYWRDYAALEAWSRTLPHREWWQNFLRDTGGTGFWHEAYFMRGGMEAIYDELPAPVGFMNFAPAQTARGAMFSSRHRVGLGGAAQTDAPLSEVELYEPTNE